MEKGELESTGGRKAVLIGLKSDYRYALGVDISKVNYMNWSGFSILALREFTLYYQGTSKRLSTY